MEFPIGVNGTTTVNELIAALLTFPPSAEVRLWCNYMQDAGLTVDAPDGAVDVMEY